MPPLSRLIRSLTPPADERTRVRWIFAVFTVFNAVLLVVALGWQQENAAPIRAGLVVGLAAVSIRWVLEYRGRDFGPAWDAVEAGVLLAAALAGSSPLNV